MLYRIADIRRRARTKAVPDMNEISSRNY
jgi:hypothetical protein